MVKKSKGRQKIEMVRMENESNLQVTFSKRRSGLFKKASELCTLCGAEVAIIVFSPGRKVFSFGHPNVESILDRFIMDNNDLPPPPPPFQPNNMQLVDANQDSSIQDLNNHLTEVTNQLEAEKKKYEELKKIREQTKLAGDWREDAIEGFNLAQVNEFKSNLEDLKKIVTLEASKLLQAHIPHQNFYVGSSSDGGFGVDGGNNNVNPADMDMFNQRRMMDVNAFNNDQTTNLPNYALSFGNNGGYGNVPEGFVPDHNMNYMPEYNQNQNLSFKREDASEYEQHHQGHPPPAGPESFGYFHGHPSSSGPGPSGYYLGHYSQSGVGPSDIGIGLSCLGIGSSGSGAGSSGFGGGPSNLAIGPSGFGAGPSNLAIGPSGFGVGPSNLAIGPSNLAIGPSGFGAGPSNLAIGPSGSGAGASGFGAGPSGFGAGPSGFGAGPSNLGIGLSGSGIGLSGSGFRPSDFGAGSSGSGVVPSGYYQGQHSQHGVGPSDSEAGPSDSRTGPSSSGTEPSGYYHGHPPHSGPSGY